MKKKNNKGFTLVELITATAILSFLALVTSAIMTTGTNMFSGVQKRSNVLYKSQVASLQLDDIFVNVGSEDGIAIVSAGAVATDGDAGGASELYIADKSERKLTKFELDTERNILRMKEYKIEVSDGSSDPPTVGSNPEVDVPFSSSIQNIEFSPHYDKVNGINYAYALNFTLTVKKNDLTYDKSSLVMLKNKPMFTSGENAVQELLALLWR